MTFDLILGHSPFGLLGFQIGLLFMEVLLFATSLFLMLLVLVQRGKGGGLTGALGGQGGQSAFGSKAGDAFTKITIVTAVIWITLCMVTIAAFNPPPPSKTITQQLDAQSGSISSSGDADENSSLEGAGQSADDSASTSEAAPLGGDGSDTSPDTPAVPEDNGIELDLNAPESAPDVPALDPAASDSAAPASADEN